MLDDAIDRLQGLDDSVDGAAVMRAAGSVRPEPADPLVAALRDELVELVIQPRRPTRAGHPSPAAERRARRAAACFDEGYLIGRVGLDTHRLALRWSGGRLGHDLDTLRRLVLHPHLTAAYARTTRLAPVVADLLDQARGLPGDQATQFAGLGLLTAVAEWTVVVGTPAHRSELLLAVC